MGIKSIRNITSCRSIQELNFVKVNITDNCLGIIVRNCRLISTLKISDSRKLTDQSVETIAKGLNEGLKVLVMQDWKSVTDNGLTCLASKCPNLHELVLGSCDATECSIIKLLEKTNLKLLALIDCNRISEQGFVEMSRCLKSIEDLDLGFTDCVTDKVIQQIAEHCQQLRRLGITHNNLTDIGLQAITSKLGSSLKYLNISYCHQLTEAVIRNIAISCKQLDALEILGLSRVVSNDSASFLRSKINFVRYNNDEEFDEDSNQE